MSHRPLLLLDVDGPLNPFGARFVRPRGYVTRRLRPANWSARQVPGSRRLRRGLRVRLNPGHGAQLMALPYKLAWATTWMHEANEMIAPVIGLPGDLPVIEWPEMFVRDPEGLYWKTRHVVAWAAGRPFVWVDDMITDLDVRHVAAHHDAAALLLQIDPRKGLRERDFEELERWARGLGRTKG
ncbi:HAD domain-containing protein [Streptomyces sp. NBC_00286]|uniref:HAD domain-containing protein n=1 Tax=Streptomyces sp. NBC_00286 TaxID=2975701 RepID=UPI002E2A7B92|nr:HAD domain-containing protein [Streptomyces sp. NBC_00286]